MSLAGPTVQVMQRPRLVAALITLALGIFIAFAVWFGHHPASLATSETPVNASTPVEEPVYVGVFNPGPAFGRTLTLSGVKVHTTANTEVSVTPLLCLDGAVGVTSDPNSFCSDVVNPEGQQLSGDDSIMVEVSSDTAAIAVVDQVRLGFREGLQWGTVRAGSPAIVRILSR